MTLFLRTKNNETIVDLDIWIKKDNIPYVEISCSINIKNYSLLLLRNPNPRKQLEIITDFDQLDEIRGWLWEVYFATKKNTEKEYSNVLREVKWILSKVAEKYDLHLVED